MTKIICLFVFLTGNLLYGQIDKSRDIAYQLVQDSLGNKIEGIKHLIFSVADKYFIIAMETDDNYIEYYFNLEPGSEKSEYTIFVKPHKVLDKALKEENYFSESIDYTSDFYKNKEIESMMGNPVYFVLYDEKKKRYGEAFLNIVVNPNPIDKEIFDFVRTRILLR